MKIVVATLETGNPDVSFGGGPMVDSGAEQVEHKEYIEKLLLINNFLKSRLC